MEEKTIKPKRYKLENFDVNEESSKKVKSWECYVTEFGIDQSKDVVFK